MGLRKLAAGAAVVAALAVASGAPAQVRVAPLAEGEAWVFMPTPGIFDREDFPRFASSEEAQRLVARIMGTVGLAPRFEVYAGPVGNAAARIEDGGVRVIYYSESWVQQTIAKDEWMAVALLAHEVGHHLNNHTLQRLEDRPLQELEADKFAGFVVGKLGGALADAQRLYETLPLKGGRSHPGRADRLEAVAVGWREGARAPAPTPARPARSATSPDWEASTPPVVSSVPSSSKDTGQAHSGRHKLYFVQDGDIGKLHDALRNSSGTPHQHFQIDYVALPQLVLVFTNLSGNTLGLLGRDSEFIEEVSPGVDRKVVLAAARNLCETYKGGNQWWRQFFRIMRRDQVFEELERQFPEVFERLKFDKGGFLTSPSCS